MENILNIKKHPKQQKILHQPHGFRIVIIAIQIQTKKSKQKASEVLVMTHEKLFELPNRFESRTPRRILLSWYFF